MKESLIIIFIVCFSGSVTAQRVRIPDSTLQNIMYKKLLIREDSLITEYNDPLIEVLNFKIVFKNCTFNRKNREMRIRGRICFGTLVKSCAGLPGVSISLAEKGGDNIISNEVEVGESSHGGSNYKRYGYFDAKFVVQNDRSLFFFIPHFYMAEYKVGQLMEQLNSR